MALSLDANPALAASLESHSAAVMHEGRVPRLTKELCAALVAGLHFCKPALIEHRREARRLGASAQMLTDLWNNASSQHYDDAQRAALAAAVALTREPRAMPQTVSGALRAHFDEAQIAELMCAIGLANYRDRVRNALDSITQA